MLTKWNLEPGDGTGCSMADASVRNNNGICAIMGCGQKLENEIERFCQQHKKELLKCLE